MQTNALRGILAEFGIAMPVGHKQLLKTIQGELARAQQLDLLPADLLISVQEQIKRIDAYRCEFDALSRWIAQTPTTMPKIFDGTYVPIKNPILRDFEFLREMRADLAYPPHLVDRGVALLVQLCEEIEEKKPAGLKQLYGITLRTMVLFNELYDDFLQEDCEIEAIGQGIVGSDVLEIAEAYGFDADYEELIAVSAFSLSSEATETFDALVRLFVDEEDSGAVQIASAARSSPS